MEEADRARPVFDEGDRWTLRHLAGATTFERGRVYARNGAVVRHGWESGLRVVGDVLGAAGVTYRTAVSLACPDDRLQQWATTCTCPVGVGCKHAVALVLQATRPDDAGGPPALSVVGSPTAASPPTSRSRRPAWDTVLRPLLAVDGGVVGPAPVPFGLQLEVTPRRGTDPGIRIRPVVPGARGNWVRGGLSWSNYEYQAGIGDWSPGAEARRARLRELVALGGLGRPRAVYGYGEVAVWLDEIGSRRVWDLLGELSGLGVAIVGAHRSAPLVHLSPEPAAASVDLGRSAGRLVLRPRIVVADREVPTAGRVLLGEPAHGLAWWDDPAAPNGPGGLHLAALATSLDDGLRRFLSGGPVEIPRNHEEEFWTDLYPGLVNRLRVTSSAGDVEIPTSTPPGLVLTVVHEPGPRIGLVWELTGSWRRRTLDGPLSGEEAVVVDRVTGVLWSVPAALESTVFGERPTSPAELSGPAVIPFVSEVLPALERLDGVEVRHDGEVPEYREADEAPVVRLGGAASENGDWFDLEVEVTVGDEEVPFAELFVALASGQPVFVLPSGMYFPLDAVELHELAELIAEARLLTDVGGEDGRLRVNRFQASLWEELVRLGIPGSQAGEWQRSVEGLTSAADRTELPPPSGLHARLRPYQLDGYRWLAYLREHRLGGVLADDMGLGKTLQALALVCHTIETGQTSAPYLVVAPTSVVGNWAAEADRFAPDLAVVAITETGSRRGVDVKRAVAGADLVVTSYALFRIEHAEYTDLPWAGLFLDEAQFVKNRASKAYSLARSLPTPCKVAMTGTPMENNLMELWSLLSITAPGLFPDPGHFTEQYRNPIERQGDDERLDRLRRRIRPLLLRRTKEQVAADLPAKQEQVLELELAPRHRKVYQTYLQRERQKVLGLIGDMQRNRFEIFRSLTLLRQASLDPGLVEEAHAKIGSAKLDALEEMVKEVVGDGHRVLVFSQFTRFLGLARRRIEAAGIDHCYLDGKTPRRAEVIERFRSGQAPVFLISLKAGGFGLNLTEADYCVLLDPWWNPATEAQAVDRIHRIGQRRQVMVYRMVAKDTIEEKVMALKARKAALFANVVDGGGFEHGVLTAEDIRGLISR